MDGRRIIKRNLDDSFNLKEVGKFYIKKIFYKTRRTILKKLIPEFIWPRHVLLDSVPIRVRNMPYSFGVKSSLIKDTYEKVERQLIKNHLKQGDIIFEFGSSIGILTQIMMNKIGQAGMIVAVEASSKLAATLKMTFEKCNNVKIINGFAFPVNQLNDSIRVTYFDQSGGSLGGRISYSKNTSKIELDEKIYDIKKLTDQFKVMPDIIVMDIEGSEKILSEQYPNFPERVRMILIELHPYIYGLNTMHTILDSIISEGFTIASSQDSVYLLERNLEI